MKRRKEGIKLRGRKEGTFEEGRKGGRAFRGRKEGTFEEGMKEGDDGWKEGRKDGMKRKEGRKDMPV